MTDLGIVVPDVAPEIHNCKNGHPQTPENVYWHKQSQRFYCRVCRRLREQGKLVANPRETVWTDETIAELRRGLDLNHSASWIADDIFRIHGWKVSRSAVCGKIFRLGLNNPMPVTRERKARGPRKPRVAIGDRGWQAKPRMVKVVEPEPIMDEAIPLHQRRTLLELGPDECKWPCGDPVLPDFYFCGGSRIEGLSYCPFHARVAYQPSVPRRPFIPMRSQR